MSGEYKERMKRLPLHELKKIVDGGGSKFKQTAIDAATDELELRNRLKISIENSKLEDYKRKNLTGELNRNRPQRPFRFIKSLVKLILNPDTHRIQTSNRKRLLLTIRFYFLSILLLFLSLIPAMVLGSILEIELPKQTAFQINKISDFQDRIYMTLLIPVLAAVIEESSFRLVLSRFNHKYFNISIAFIASFFTAKLFGTSFFNYSTYQSSYLLQSVLVQLILGLPVYFSLSKTNLHSSWFEKNWRRSYKWFFYGLALIFAFGHLPNFTYTKEDFLMWPLMLLPFLVYAFSFSYVRIRIGFKYAVLLHFIVDAVIVISKVMSS